MADVSNAAEEIKQGLAAYMRAHYGEGDHSAEMFAEFDGDKDGRLTHAEVGRMFEAADVGGLFRPAYVKGLIQAFDDTGDGTLDYEEVALAIRSSAPGKSDQPAPDPMGPPPPPPSSSSSPAVSPSLLPVLLLGGALALAVVLRGR